MGRRSHRLTAATLMARYQIILAYDGTGFSGSQRQANARTVQGVLETALRSLGWTGRSVWLAGRTDAGVHAEGQVAAFDLDWPHPVAALQRALNAHLPPDVAVRALRRAADGFHPRFSARSRRYRYHLYCQSVRDPLQERYAWRVWPPLDGAVLQQVSRLFAGEHDFSAFGTPPRPESTPVRQVFYTAWRQEGDHWFYEVEANAFLYRMVRRLVFVQTAVAQGRLSLAAVTAALQNGQAGIPLAGLAPARGLTLVQVRYAPD